MPGGHACGLGCRHGAPPGEPTQAEYKGAVQESYRELQAVVVAINEALEEVAQLRLDVEEEGGE